MKEFAGGYMNTSQGVVKEDSLGGHFRRHAGAYVGTAVVPVLGTGIGALIDAARKRSNLIKTADERVASAKTAAALGGERMMSANLKPALRELAARSGRIVEFGDGEADEAVIAALKAAASADETPAQRAMLLKRGLIQMVKGQLVINERGYEMMQKAGVPPKLTPEERREEIVGTEEKRLSRFDHRGHREHGVEFARGDYVIKHMKLNPGAWRGATDTKRAAQGKFSQRMTEAIQEVLDDKRTPPQLPFSVSNNRGAVAADYAKQARDELAMDRKQIASWLKIQRGRAKS